MYVNCSFDCAFKFVLISSKMVNRQRTASARSTSRSRTRSRTRTSEMTSRDSKKLTSVSTSANPTSVKGDDSSTSFITRFILAIVAPFLLLHSNFSGYSSLTTEGVTDPNFRGGDFHAHKKWITTTCHLPTDEWYYHDTNFWGLDYPPGGALLHKLIAKFVCNPNHNNNDNHDNHFTFDDPYSSKEVRTTMCTYI